jgi:hypothetical protein
MTTELKQVHGQSESNISLERKTLAIYCQGRSVCSIVLRLVTLAASVKMALWRS